MTHPTLSVEQRIERLERMVEQIHAHLGLPPQDSEAPEPASAPPLPPRPVAPTTSRRAPSAELWAHHSEQWLGRVGLGLLFLGLVYLFNYSIEQGWITPVVRVGVGLAIGSTLLAFGVRLQRARRSYSQLLLAGALAAYYVTGWAAFQLYQLVGHTFAFGYLSVVMVLALALARRQDHPSLASLGAAGGFATPLLLHPEPGRVVELAAYSALVVGWTGVLYWLRGWPSLLWTYTVGGLAALGLAAHQATGGERWVVQAALALTWLAGAALPFVRGTVQPEGRVALRRTWGAIPVELQLRALGVSATTAAVLFTDRMWALGDRGSSALFLGIAVLYAAFAERGTRSHNPVARAAAPVAAALCATGTFLLLRSVDDVLSAVLAVQAGLFVWGGSHRRFAGLEWVGHPLFFTLALAFVFDASSSYQAAFDPLSLAQLTVLGVALAASRFVRRGAAVWAYRLVAHLLFLAWLAKELEPLPASTGLVTLAWGAYGAVLLVAALQWRDRRSTITHGLQLVAFSALALAVLKLILSDLGRVAMVWRILLFMGFGAALLGLSSLFKPRAPTESRRVAPSVSAP